MKLIPVEFSIVVIATHHNPSIVTADFLKNNKIVPEEFEAKGENTICTPIGSQIIYKQGISITVDPERAIFIETIKIEDVSKNSFQCPNIVERFIDTLKFVNYRAVGFNQKFYAAASEEKNPQQIIFNTLIKDGGWNTFQNSKTQVQVSFIYSYDEKKLTLNVNEVEIESAFALKQKFFGFQVNFHHDIKKENQEEKVNSVKSIIKNYQQDINELHQFLENSFLKEFSK